MSHPAPLRFFWATSRPGYAAVSAAALLVSGAAWSALRDPDDFDQFVLLALSFQMFSASSGYRRQALRGHFDSILTAGSPRTACACAHFAVSIAPGMAVWLVIAGLAWAFQPGRAPGLGAPALGASALGAPALGAPALGAPALGAPALGMTSASALVAALYASTLCWTISLPLRRYAGGVLWLALIFALAAGHQLHSFRESFLMSSGGWWDTFALTGAALVVPVYLIANPQVAGVASLGLVLSVTAAAWIAGACFIARFSGVLEDRS
jgi:hypothetical protein